MSIGKRIRAIRTSKGFSQEYITYKVLGVSQATLSNIENGKRNLKPDSPKLQQIAAALEVPISELLQVESSPSLAHHPLLTDDIQGQIKVLRDSVVEILEKIQYLQAVTIPT